MMRIMQMMMKIEGQIIVGEAEKMLYSREEKDLRVSAKK
jgi:hypothetical protein